MKKTKKQSLEDLIKKGKFTYVNSSITKENFPQEEIRSEKYKLFHFDRSISSEDAISEMTKEGYSPANIYELLSWTEWNDKDWVVGLGSVAEVVGSRRVPYLDRDGSERSLFLTWRDIGWDADCRFLAVRTSSLETKSSDTEALRPFDPQPLCPHCGKVLKITIK